jgi:hypothetical protein
VVLASFDGGREPFFFKEAGFCVSGWQCRGVNYIPLLFVFWQSYPGERQFFPRRTGKAITILMHPRYPRAGGLGTRVPPEKFAGQMTCLKRHGYAVVSMDDIADFGQGGRFLLAKPVAITFDDGCRGTEAYRPVEGRAKPS